MAKCIPDLAPPKVIKNYGSKWSRPQDFDKKETESWHPNQVVYFSEMTEQLSEHCKYHNLSDRQMHTLSRKPKNPTDLTVDNYKDHQENICSKMSFNRFYSQFMEIPEYPPDIQKIDEGFESLSAKSHHESDLKVHKKNTLQAIDDQKEYLSSQLMTPTPPREQE